MKNVAVIDIGSNTIKVLCARQTPNGLESLGYKSHEARLGGDDKDGKPWLADHRRALALEAIQSLLDFANGYNPGKISLVATSAIREASNQGLFCQEILEKTAHPLRVLRGEEEARYIGSGIAQDPTLPDQANFTAFDLGGGSLERTVYQDGHLATASSFKLGAVRLTKEICKDNGATPLAQQEICSIRERILESLPDPASTSPLVGSGGVFTITRTILLSRLPGNESLPPGELLSQAHFTNLPLETLKEFAEETGKLPLEDRTKIPYLPPGRADILPTALHIVITIAEKYGADAWHPTLYNLRFGIAKELLEQSGN